MHKCVQVKCYYDELTRRQHRDAAVSLRRENVDQRVAVLVERDAGTRFQQLTVNCRQNTHVIVGTWFNMIWRRSNSQKISFNVNKSYTIWQFRIVIIIITTIENAND